MSGADAADRRRRGSIERWLCASQAGLGAAFFASWCAFALLDRYRVPYRDDWDWLSWTLTNGLSLRGLLQPHNEHLIPLIRLLDVLQYRLEGSGAWLLFGVAVLSQVGVGWMFWREIRRRWPGDGPTAVLLAGTTAACLFFSYQLQSFVHMAAVLFPLVQAFAVASVVCLLNAAESGRPWRRGWLAAAGVAALGAAATTTNGFAVPCLLAVLAWVRRGPRRVVGAFMGGGLLGAMTYLFLVGLPWDRVSGGLSDGVASPRAMAVFFFSFVSSPLVYATVTGGAIVGAAMVAAGAYAFWQVSARRSVDRIEMFAASVMAFALASAAMAALARAPFGPVEAAEPRYTTFALAYDAALVLWFASRFDLARLRSGVRLSIEAAAVAGVMGLFAAHLFLGLVWKAKADNVAVAGLALAADVHDDAWISNLHPVVSVVYDTAARLRQAGRLGLSAPHLGELLSPPAGLPLCAATVTASAVPSSAWRIEGTLPSSAAGGLAVDEGGRVIGLARLAPLVAVPNPTQLEVVAAVWRSLVHPRPRERRAIGFATAVPASFYGMTPDGALLCRSPVANASPAAPAGGPGYTSPGT